MGRRELFLNRRHSRTKRLRLLERLLNPVLFYAAGTWTPGTHIRQALKSFQLRFYRWVLGVFRAPGESRADFFRRIAGLARAEMAKIEAQSWDDRFLALTWGWGGATLPAWHLPG